MEVAQLLNSTEATNDSTFLQSTIFFKERSAETQDTSTAQTPNRWITIEEAEAATILFCFDTMITPEKTPSSPSSVRNANSCKYHRKYSYILFLLISILDDTKSVLKTALIVNEKPSVKENIEKQHCTYILS